MSTYSERLSRRQNSAEIFDNAMYNRYGEIAYDCTTWESLAIREYSNFLANPATPDPNIEHSTALLYNPLDLIDRIEGVPYKSLKSPKPLPFSPKFLYRFCEILNGRAIDLIPTLEALFDKTDEVDSDYVSGLISDVEHTIAENPKALQFVDGYGKINVFVYDFFNHTAKFTDRQKWVLVNMEAQNKGINGSPLFDSVRLRQGLATIRSWLSRRDETTITKSQYVPEALPSPTVAQPKPSEKPSYSSFYEAVEGKLNFEQLNLLLSNQYLAMYDSVKKELMPAAQPGDWASLYWALKLRGLLPRGLSAEKGAKLLKSTFGACVSKTRITDIGREDVDQINSIATHGSAVARIYDLLGEPTMQSVQTSSTDRQAGRAGSF
ncbi:hypothetical protein [Hymenobacter jejuensis]|uniref:Uncharacterized protein n=1 Tax=Hymenobacter jejuensis TaxID=2502781 RepID=A0A5B7ZYJ6_9BACT|nr:hypothetical protein [Hymenobacter jejuensis]QDA60264.1 hypothetical protein FHG12_09125 [Hymenobacter jejuensis]